MKSKILNLITITILLVAMLFGLTACENKEEKTSKMTPESVAEDYFKNISKNDFSKAFKLIDWQGYVMVSEEYYNYSEIEDRYDEFSEEYKDKIQQMEEYVNSFSGTIESEYGSYEKFNIEVKNVEKAKKVEGTKNLYSVGIKVNLEIQKDEGDIVEKDTKTYEIYVMKKDSKYYIIGGIDDFMNNL